MTFFMRWEVKPVAQAGQDFADIEAAVTALEDSVRRILERVPDAPMGLAVDTARVVRRMRSEAPADRPWGTVSGAVRVWLVPR